MSQIGSPTGGPTHLVQLVVSDADASESLKAIMDLVILAYYFLMRPGQYCNSMGEESSHPFHTDDVELWLGHRKLNLLTATDHELLTATFCILEFTDQKNANRGEQVGHPTSGDYIFCPVRALPCHIMGSRPIPPSIVTMNNFKDGNCVRPPPPRSIYYLDRPPPYLATTLDITVKALRATGAMSLITACISSNLIRLLGRWQSNSMLRYYLHVQAIPMLQNFTRDMNAHGHFLALPDAGVPLHQRRH
jgi:hypothetical protein